MAPKYAFHPMSTDHLPMIRRWLEAPDVVRCYALGTWNQGFGSQPPATRGIDQFIGAPDMIGHGHGARFVRQFTEGLLTSGVPRVVTDPDPANGRAVCAYAKAGFQSDRIVDTPDGPALLMVRNP